MRAEVEVAPSTFELFKLIILLNQVTLQGRGAASITGFMRTKVVAPSTFESYYISNCLFLGLLGLA